MAWLAVESNKAEYIYTHKPERGMWEDNKGEWCINEDEIDYPQSVYILLPKGSIEKLIGRVLTWQDEPVEIK